MVWSPQRDDEMKVQLSAPLLGGARGVQKDLDTNVTQPAASKRRSDAPVPMMQHVCSSGVAWASHRLPTLRGAIRSSLSSG